MKPTPMLGSLQGPSRRKEAPTPPPMNQLEPKELVMMSSLGYSFSEASFSCAKALNEHTRAAVKRIALIFMILVLINLFNLVSDTELLHIELQI